METTSPENYLYIGIAIVLVVFTIVMFIQGWMMKFAVRICGGNEIGIFYGVSALTLSSLGGVAASAALMISMPGVSPLLSVVASLAGTIGVLCLMLQMGPIRAFGVYLCQLLLSIFAIGATGAAIGVGIYFIVPAESLQKFADNAQTQVGDINPASFGGMNESDGPEVDVKNLDQLAKILNFDMGEGSGNSGKSEQSMFSKLTNSSTEKVANTSAPKVEPKKKPVVQSPFDNKIRSNPFAN